MRLDHGDSPPTARSCRPSRSKLGDLMAATTLFDLDRRVAGDGKPAVIYARDKRHPAQAQPG
jgi:hypothetical protein